MLNDMNTVIYQILGWSFLLTAVMTPILIIVQSVRSYNLIKLDKETFTFKALAALCVWMFLTLGMIFILGMLAYVIGHAMATDPTVKPHSTPGFIGLHLIYIAVCYLLVDWVSRRKTVNLR